MNKRIFVVQSVYYPHIAALQWQAAQQQLQSMKCNFEYLSLHGVLETPLVAQWAAQQPDAAGIVVLGCVLRGQTIHYDVVVQQSARALIEIMLTYNKPIANGIIAADTEEQALQRADVAQKNRAAEAVSACVALVDVHNLFLRRGHEHNPTC